MKAMLNTMMNTAAYDAIKAYDFDAFNLPCKNFLVTEEHLNGLGEKAKTRRLRC